MVRFKYLHRRCPCAEFTVSIPLWFDSNDVLTAAEDTANVESQFHYGSIQIAPPAAPQYYAGPSQFHYGSIQINNT